jgi:hypothetical protein
MQLASRHGSPRTLSEQFVVEPKRPHLYSPTVQPPLREWHIRRVIESTPTYQPETAFPWIAALLFWCTIALVGVTLGVTRNFDKRKPLYHNRFHHLFD